jgi:two-component sensor histidine kinase
MPTVSTRKPTLTVTLPPSLESPGRLRRLLHRHGIDQDLEHTVSLLATELVANSIKHATGSPDIRVAAALDEDFVRVEVLDTGPGFDPGVRHESSGFGLRLVDKLASRWGVERGDLGTVVWFEIDRRSRRFRRSES